MNDFPKNSYVDYEWNDGILHITFLPGEPIDLAAAIRIVEDRIKIQNGMFLPILCDIRKIPEIEKDAKDYFAQEGSHMIKALAFLVNPNMNYIKYRYYILFQKGKIPTQAYTELEEGLDFLKGHLEQGTEMDPEFNDNE